MKSWFPLVSLVNLLMTSPAVAKAPVIYGLDNRQEIFEASPLQQRLALSAATMIKAKNITQIDDSPNFKLDQTTFKQWLESAMAESSEEEVKGKVKLNLSEEIKAGIGFCPDERFTEQPNPGMCSGFLIGPDLLVTAGHCVKIENFCSDYRWVFDFKVDKKTGKAGEEVSPDNIYSCKKVVSSALNMPLGLDYGLVILDRKVSGREPLELETSNKVAQGTELIVIGSPSGLPLKVASGSKVRTTEHSFFFLSNLDTYQGNSGSAVFNAQSGVVEGILVRGEDDFVPNTVAMCLESKKCLDNECRGEAVTRLSAVPELSFSKLLHQAATSGDEASMDQILKLSLWVDVYGKNGVSPLMRAAKSQATNIISMLLKKGADAKLSDVNEDTVLHYLAINLTEKNSEALKVLVEAGASLEAKNKVGNTPLLIAAKWNNLSAVKLLINSGADKNATNMAGDNILSSFLKAGDSLAINELLALGVDPTFATGTQVSAAK